MQLVMVNNYREREKGQQALQNLSRCMGQPLQLVDQAAPELEKKILDHKPDLVVLTGPSAMLTRSGTREEFNQEIDFIKKAPVPILGICFGHQLIGTTFGSGLSDLGQMSQKFEQVKIVNRHPLFDGLPPKITVAESHKLVLNKVPMGFQRLAESSVTSIEAIRHETKPIYGVQFHPERSTEQHTDGRILLQNLLKITRARA